MATNKSFIPALVIVLTLCCAAGSTAAGGEEIDCRMDAGPCEKMSGKLLVTLDINPRPLKVMSELVFTAGVRDRGMPVTDASLLVNLTMPGMVMGNNSIRLSHKGGGIYDGTGVIIRCPTGKKKWKATVMVERSGSRKTADYVFEVTR